MSGRIAVIGGGVCGLTAALRLAQDGHAVTLFEAAPEAGGRTRSFIDNQSDELCDNGPHLLAGAYHATTRLLRDCRAEHHINWQHGLQLPLWDAHRGHFCLSPTPRLPFAIAMLTAVASMPGHGWSSALAMLRLNMAIRQQRGAHNASVAELLQRCRMPDALIRDMLEPICLGAMNEALESANAASFGRVLLESFSTARNARLGWFNAPLQQALVEPLVHTATAHGAIIHTCHAVRSLQAHARSVSIDGQSFDTAIIALPAYARNRLLGINQPCETRPITNVHLWYRQHPGLKQSFIGAIGTLGQWFFDISAQMGDTRPEQRHICAVISAYAPRQDHAALAARINDELSGICGTACTPAHVRIVCEKRATVLVRPSTDIQLPEQIIDACEHPQPGELPATIELAVQRGEQAAITARKQLQ